MARGDNREKRNVAGQTVWFNPNTGRYFGSKTSNKPLNPFGGGGSTSVNPPGGGGKPPPIATGGRGGGPVSTETGLDSLRDSLAGSGLGGGTPAGFDPTTGTAVGTKTVGGVTQTVYLVDGKYYTEDGKQVNSYRPYGDDEKGSEEGTGDTGDYPPNWTKDPDGNWVQIEDPQDALNEQKRQNDLFAEYARTLEEFGLTGLDEFLKQSVREDWNESTFLIRLRREQAYLANPLFAANMQRAAYGKGFLSEAQVIAYGAQAKSVAKAFGYKEPSDAYIAQGFLGGLSIAEYEHRFKVQERVNQYGAGVALAYREIMGVDPSDQDLFEIFDDEISTKEFDDAARQAEMRGRPFTLGLGIRSEAEARALEMLGVNPDEAFQRYQGVAQNASRFERLGTIESMIAQGLPDDFGSQFGTMDNSLLIRGLVFQDQEALAMLQNYTAKEAARWRAGGGAQATQGQLVGLLSDAQRASYG